MGMAQSQWRSDGVCNDPICAHGLMPTATPMQGLPAARSASSAGVQPCMAVMGRQQGRILQALEHLLIARSLTSTLSPLQGLPTARSAASAGFEPYVAVIGGGTGEQRTPAAPSGQGAPEWRHALFVRCGRGPSGLPSLRLQLQVRDARTGALDPRVGGAEFDSDKFDAEQLQRVVLPVQLYDPKCARTAGGGRLCGGGRPISSHLRAAVRPPRACLQALQRSAAVALPKYAGLVRDGCSLRLLPPFNWTCANSCRALCSLSTCLNVSMLAALPCRLALRAAVTLHTVGMPHVASVPQASSSVLPALCGPSRRCACRCEATAAMYRVCMSSSTAPGARCRVAWVAGAGRGVGGPERHHGLQLFALSPVTAHLHPAAVALPAPGVCKACRGSGTCCCLL
jgi:hypothetical protein